MVLRVERVVRILVAETDDTGRLRDVVRVGDGVEGEPDREPELVGCTKDAWDSEGVRGGVGEPDPRSLSLLSPRELELALS